MAQPRARRARTTTTQGWLGLVGSRARAGGRNDRYDGVGSTGRAETRSVMAISRRKRGSEQREVEHRCRAFIRLIFGGRR